MADTMTGATPAAATRWFCEDGAIRCQESTMNDIAIELPVADSDDSDRVRRDELFARLEKTRTCMLVTHDKAGAAHVRPMTTQQVDRDGILWMFTAANGHIANEVAEHPGVLLLYSDTG